MKIHDVNGLSEILKFCKDNSILTIADEVKIAAQSGIGGSIKTKGQIVQGSPALPIGDFKKSYVHFRNLHQLSDSITEIKNKLPKTDNHG